MEGPYDLSAPLLNVVPDEAGFVGGIEVGMKAERGAQTLLVVGQKFIT